MSGKRETHLRFLDSPEDCQRVEDLQRQIWPGSETTIVPLHVLTTVAHSGGVLLGAFDGEALVGFVFGFLGTDESDPGRPALARLKHCSHMLGVLPEYRDGGVGYRLKLAQREAVMQQGVRLITWTYDPLESRNAHLNIAKLRAVVRSYLRDVYGLMSDALNAGLPSDRFQVEWWITSQRVRQGLSAAEARRPLGLEAFTSAGAQILNPSSAAADGTPRPAERGPQPAGSLALAEIPADFQALKSKDLALARAWRQQTRALFESLFASGYLIIDFVHATVGRRPRSFYVLSRADAGASFSEN